jgi:hypothetical protein
MGWRENAPKPLRWPCKARSVERRRVSIAEKAAPVQARHHAGSALARHEIGMAAHRIGLVGDVEGDHHRFAGAVLMPPHRCHHGRNALRQRRMHRIGRNLVVLDEVEPGFAQRGDERGGLGRAQADIGLDDRADHRPLRDAGQLARAGDALRRQRESGCGTRPAA